jgi:cystathionine gamma-lyase
MKSQRLETICVHAGMTPEATTGAVIPPVFQTSTYVQSEPGKAKVYDYARAGNPTRTALEEALAALEGARHAISFASGLAAVQAIAQMWRPGDHILVCDDVYGGTGRMFRRMFAHYDIKFDFIDMSSAAEVRAHITPKTRLIWMETPTNPLLKLIDIVQVCEIAKTHSILTVVDNTFASPIFQSPLALGATMVLHSTTKYIGGHSDLVGGAIMLNDDALAQELHFTQFAGGSVNAPFEAFLLLRSIKTLSLRMKKHHENAMILAQKMETLPCFSQVIFPGLKSHPHHDLARTQMRGFSGMISARIRGNFEEVIQFLSGLRVFSLAESLGGVESLVNHPETMTHASVPAEHRKKIGITSDLLRFSVGIEDIDDLIDDISNAVKGLL